MQTGHLYTRHLKTEEKRWQLTSLPDSITDTIARDTIGQDGSKHLDTLKDITIDLNNVWSETFYTRPIWSPGSAESTKGIITELASKSYSGQ